MLKKIKKQIIIMQAKWHAFKYEKTYIIKENPTIQRYLFMRCKGANTLLVVFPACFKGGAKYDYVSTVQPFTFHKLFLLDDQGKNGRGNYLMGKNRETAISLIKTKIKELGVTKIIFAGSSKGGAMAVIFAHYIENVDVVCGAPTYHLAHRMYDGQNRQNVETIIDGDITEQKVNEFDNSIRKLILNSTITPKTVSIMYSKAEPTYETNIADLLEDMAKRDYPVKEFIRDFNVHSLVGKYFKPFLQEYLSNYK